MALTAGRLPTSVTSPCPSAWLYCSFNRVAGTSLCRQQAWFRNVERDCHIREDAASHLRVTQGGQLYHVLCSLQCVGNTNHEHTQSTCCSHAHSSTATGLGVNLFHQFNYHRSSCLHSAKQRRICVTVPLTAVLQQALDAHASHQRILQDINQVEARCTQSNKTELYKGQSNDKCGWQPTPFLGSRHDCSRGYLVSAQKQPPLRHKRL